MAKRRPPSRETRWILRVLGGLGLSSFGTNLEAHELLMEISVLAPNSRQGLQNFRQKVQQDTEAGVLGEALEPIANCLQRRDPGWCTNDRDIDSLWDSFADELVRLGESKIDREYLVKPSGPLKAPLTSLWVYPTLKTRHPNTGMSTIGPTRPSGSKTTRLAPTIASEHKIGSLSDMTSCPTKKECGYLHRQKQRVHRYIVRNTVNHSI